MRRTLALAAAVLGAATFLAPATASAACQLDLSDVGGPGCTSVSCLAAAAYNTADEVALQDKLTDMDCAL